MSDLEKERVDAVHRYLKTDFNKIPQLQEIVDLAAELFDKPVAMITLLDEHVSWLKARTGINRKAMARAIAFCPYALGQDGVLLVPDASSDSRFNSNPLVHTPPYFRFYAGAPLTIKNGLKLGTLCLFDTKPGMLTKMQEKTLVVFAAQVTSLLELKVTKTELEHQVAEIEAKSDLLKRIAYMQSHDIRQPVATILGLVNLVKENLSRLDKDWLNMLDETAGLLDDRVRTIVEESIFDKDLKAIRYHKMTEEIEDYAILLLDEKGNIENWNKGAEIVKGYKASEVIGKNFRIFYTPEDRARKRPEQLIAQAIQFGFAKDEGWRVKKGGERFWGSILITAIHNDNHDVIGFTKVTKDLKNKPAHENQSKI